eukprot:g7185.t1
MVARLFGLDRSGAHTDLQDLLVDVPACCHAKLPREQRELCISKIEPGYKILHDAFKRSMEAGEGGNHDAIIEASIVALKVFTKAGEEMAKEAGGNPGIKAAGFLKAARECSDAASCVAAADIAQQDSYSEL